MILPSEDWHRCSPRYVLSVALATAARWVIAVLGILAVYVIYTVVTMVPRADINNALPFGVFGIVGIALAAIVVLGAYSIITTVVRLRSLRYRLAADRIEMRSGVLRETSMTLPYAKINAVETTRSVWDKLLGLNSLACQSASDQGSITIPGVPADQVETMRTFLLEQSSLSRNV